MRKAIITVAALEVLCPYCEEPLANHMDGSFLWTPDHLANEAKGRRNQFHCRDCGAEFTATALKGVRMERLCEV